MAKMQAEGEADKGYESLLSSKIEMLRGELFAAFKRLVFVESQINIILGRIADIEYNLTSTPS